MSGCQGLGEIGLWGMIANGGGVSIWGEENILELESGDDCTTICIMPLDCTLLSC